MEPETLILSEVRLKEKDKYHMISLISGDLIYSRNEPFHRKENHGLGEQTVVAKGWGGEGLGWIGNLALIDADYCLGNG